MIRITYTKPYTELQRTITGWTVQAFEHLGLLPNVSVITFQKEKKYDGSCKWVEDRRLLNIRMNTELEPLPYFATLAHELTHGWQYAHGYFFWDTTTGTEYYKGEQMDYDAIECIYKGLLEREQQALEQYMALPWEMPAYDMQRLVCEAVGIEYYNEL